MGPRRGSCSTRGGEGSISSRAAQGACQRRLRRMQEGEHTPERGGGCNRLRLRYAATLKFAGRSAGGQHEGRPCACRVRLCLRKVCSVRGCRGAPFVFMSCTLGWGSRDSVWLVDDVHFWVPPSPRYTLLLGLGWIAKLAREKTPRRRGDSRPTKLVMLNLSA